MCGWLCRPHIHQLPTWKETINRPMYAEIIVNRPIQKRPSTASPPLRDDDSRLMTFTYRLPERLREAAKHGFTRAVVPSANAPKKAIAGLEVVAVNRIGEAIDALN